ncbi:MAG: hypothetical protein ABEJ42_10715 [Halobacteriaceae archaeon]
MSNASSNVQTESPGAWPEPRAVATVARRTVATPLQFVGFWAAVALPFLYLPLVVDGFRGGEGTVFLGLLCANFAGLVLGRGYQQD